MFLLLASFNNLAGDNSKEATPDPIPNSVVKLFRVDGTAWVTVWESRSLPAFFLFLRGAFCVGCEKMPQLRTLVRAWGIFSCLLEIARAKTKNIEITAFFVFDIRKP